MPTADELTRMRATMAGAMPDTVVIKRRGAGTPTGYGGETASFTTSSTVACRFQEFTKQADTVEGDEGGNHQLYEFTLPWNADVLETDRLERSSVTYEIVGAVKAAGWQICKQVLAKKL